MGRGCTGLWNLGRVGGFKQPCDPLVVCIFLEKKNCLKKNDQHCCLISFICFFCYAAFFCLSNNCAAISCDEEYSLLLCLLFWLACWAVFGVGEALFKGCRFWGAACRELGLVEEGSGKAWYFYPLPLLCHSLPRDHGALQGGIHDTPTQIHLLCRLYMYTLVRIILILSWFKKMLTLV